MNKQDTTIAVGVCFYEDAKGLKRLVDSLAPIDPIISAIYAVDGRFVYPSYGSDNDSPLSTDLEDQKVSEIPKLKLISCGNTTEWQKRQAYVNECYTDKPDFLFVLDTDETLSFSSVTEFRAEIEQIKLPAVTHPEFIYHNVHDIKFDDRTQGIKNLKPRLWLNPSQMEYTDYMAFRNRQYRHWHTDPTGSQWPWKVPLKSVEIIHDKSLHTYEWERKNREYHRRQVLLQ